MEKVIPSDYYYLSKDQLIFSIFENLVILFERELPKKILKSEEFEEIKNKVDVLYDLIKSENL